MKINLNTEPAAIIGVLVAAIQGALSATDSAGMETVEYVQIGVLGAAILVIRMLVFAASSVDDIIAFIMNVTKERTGVDISDVINSEAVN